jgi:formate hydrogenlyase subunit 3/multisubunit Na+/H+ antiporter MnhD subunit
MPPFGLFVSELLILTAAFSTAHYFIAVLMLAAISVVFGALLHHFQSMVMGKPEGVPVRPALQASWFVVMGVCVLCLAVLGVHVPAAFAAVLRGAMAVLQPAVLQP